MTPYQEKVYKSLAKATQGNVTGVKVSELYLYMNGKKGTHNQLCSLEHALSTLLKNGHVKRSKVNLRAYGWSINSPAQNPTA